MFVLCLLLSLLVCLLLHVFVGCLFVCVCLIVGWFVYLLVCLFVYLFVCSLFAVRSSVVCWIVRLLFVRFSFVVRFLFDWCLYVAVAVCVVYVCCLFL